MCPIWVLVYDTYKIRSKTYLRPGVDAVAREEVMSGLEQAFVGLRVLYQPGFHDSRKLFRHQHP